MSQQELLSRLESVTARLEKVASKLGGKGGGDDADAVPQYVTDFEKFLKNEVEAFVKAARDLGVEQIPELTLQAFQNSLEFIRASANCVKPSNQDMMAFLKPGVDAIGQADSLKLKGKKQFADHYKAFYEGLVGISWVTMTPPMALPYQHVEAQQQAADFNLNRILKTSKDASDKDKQSAFVKSFQALNKAHKDYVGEYFKKSGLDWNPKGGDLKSYKPGQSSSTSKPSTAAPSDKPSEPEKKEPEKVVPKTGNVDSLFGELNQGLNVTSKLKKVKDEDKTKNRKDRSGKVEEPVAQQKKAGRNKGKANLEYKGGRWLVENFNEGTQNVEKADIKSNVFITMCDDTVIQIPNKVKAVSIDSCIKCQVIVNEIVSSIEIVNCKSVTLIIQQKAPAITVDKSQSPRIILMKPAFEAFPEIYTSNITAMNIEIPGVKDGDDMIEIPVPEQFLTKIDPKTRAVSTIETKHG